MNRTERQGRRTVRRIRLYTNKWLAITLRFLPRRSSTSFRGILRSSVRLGSLSTKKKKKRRIKRKEQQEQAEKKYKGQLRFSSDHLIAAHYCTQDVPGRQKVCLHGESNRMPGAGYLRRLVNAIHYPEKSNGKK